MTDEHAAGSYPPEVAEVRPGEDLDWDVADAYIRAQLPELAPLRRVLQFPNGSANLTYLLEFGDRRVVLRRPPFGQIAVGAHDMRREHRVLSKLWQAYDPGPRALLLCQDHDVVGADFLVSEYRAGQVVWGTVPPSMSGHADAGRRIGLAVVDALAELHLVEPASCGLSELGRPDGFVDRQLAGWQQRWEATSEGAELPIMDELSRRLGATKPETRRTSILHNDYKIDNCQFDPADPDRVTSVFDWDMATLGDPLVDVGTTLNYWPDPADGEDRPIHPDGLDTIGLPSRRQFVERYSELVGDPAEQVWWYEAFAAWKTAVVLQQLYLRYARGETTDERQAGKGTQVASQARRAMALLATAG